MITSSFTAPEEREKLFRAKKSLTILLTSISSDSHTWNLVFLQLLMEFYGHNVINLGCCVPDEEILDKCKMRKPDLVVVSTVNGHGYIEGNRLIKSIKNDTELRNIPIVIGGKIGIDGTNNNKHFSELMRSGFNAVFDDSGGITEFQKYITGLQTAISSNKRLGFSRG
ncbi:cobalamin B12-binding domain-containing protein [Marinobacter shengliensis]